MIKLTHTNLAQLLQLHVAPENEFTFFNLLSFAKKKVKILGKNTHTISCTFFILTFFRQHYQTFFANEPINNFLHRMWHSYQSHLTFFMLFNSTECGVLLQRQSGGVRWVTAVPYSRGQLGPAWRACGMSCRRCIKVLPTGTGMLAPLRAQSQACCKTSVWLRLRPRTPLHPPANGSAGPCLALMSSAVAALPGALRALVFGRLWRRGGATAGAASSAEVLGTRSSASLLCNAAPASASPPAPTPWSCPASLSVSPTPLRSPAWRPPPPCPCPPSPRRSPSTSLTNRSASLSLVDPRHPAPLTPLQSWSAVVDRGVSPAAAHSHASSTTRRSVWSAGDQPTLTNRGLLWTWPRWPRLVIKHQTETNFFVSCLIKGGTYPVYHHMRSNIQVC